MKIVLVQIDGIVVKTMIAISSSSMWSEFELFFTGIMPSNAHKRRSTEVFRQYIHFVRVWIHGSVWEGGMTLAKYNNGTDVCSCFHKSSKPGGERGVPTGETAGASL